MLKGSAMILKVALYALKFVSMYLHIQRRFLSKATCVIMAKGVETSPSMGFANQSAMTLTIDLQKWIKVTKTNHLKVLYVE